MRWRAQSSGLAAVVLVSVAALGSCQSGALGITLGDDAGANDAAARCAYPAGPYALEILGTLSPDLVFEGESGPVRIADAAEPCAAKPRLLVVRSSAAWCGPCGWQVDHTSRFMTDPRFANRLSLVDLLVADADNLPATKAALAPWAARIGTAGAKLAIDPGYMFAPALISRAPLPEYVFVDTRTMKIVSSLSDPDPESLSLRIEQELAAIDGQRPPSARAPTLVDGIFTEPEIDLIRGMRLAPDLMPPPDPTNAVADDPAAAALGRSLFSDRGLSPSGRLSCQTCHDSGQDFTDGRAQSIGAAPVDRNAPALGLAAHARWQFWDGRADTLWMQALGPFEESREIASSRLFVAHRIADNWADAYAAAFGSRHPLLPLEIAKMPAAGKPGDAAWESMPSEWKDLVDQVYVGVGKAIAAFERTIRVAPNALDRYAAGELTALGDPEKRGLAQFMRNGCVQCHWGPRLTDDAFHTVRFASGRQDGQPDRGRVDAFAILARAEFVASSRWSDAPSSARAFPLDAPTTLGSFKTPTLRGLPSSAPYGHGGTLATLAEVVHQYGTRGLEHADPRAIGTTEPWVPNFDTAVEHELLPFLETLAGHATTP